jgi:hypothetical protein
MELQQLLANGFARQCERIGELRDRRRPLLLQGRQNGAPAIRQLVDRENGASPVLRPVSRPVGEKFRKPYFA